MEVSKASKEKRSKYISQIEYYLYLKFPLKTLKL